MLNAQHDNSVKEFTWSLQLPLSHVVYIQSLPHKVTL